MAFYHLGNFVIAASVEHPLLKVETEQSFAGVLLYYFDVILLVQPECYT